MLIRVLPPSLFLLPVWCISLVLWRARVPRSLLRKHATCWTTASWSLRVLPDTTLPTHPSPMAYHWVSLSFLHFFKEMRGCDVSHVKNIIVIFFLIRKLCGTSTTAKLRFFSGFCFSLCRQQWKLLLWRLVIRSREVRCWHFCVSCLLLFYVLMLWAWSIVLHLICQCCTIYWFKRNKKAMFDVLCMCLMFFMYI